MDIKSRCSGAGISTDSETAWRWTRRQSCGVSRSLIRHLASRKHLFSDRCKQISWRALESFARCSLPKNALLILALKTCPLNMHNKVSLPSFFCSVCPVTVLAVVELFAAVPQAATGATVKARPISTAFRGIGGWEKPGGVRGERYSLLCGRHRLSSSTAMKWVVLSFRWLYQSF